MKGKSYTKELKEEVLREVKEVGNVSLVSRRHGISKSTIFFDNFTPLPNTFWWFTKNNNKKIKPIITFFILYHSFLVKLTFMVLQYIQPHPNL